MRLVTTRERLQSAIQAAERIVGKKESLPVLSCIVLDADSGSDLSVRSTNLEASIEIRVPCECDEKGAVAVPATIFSQTIRAISGDKITLTTEDGNLMLEARGTRTLIKALPSDDFPTFSVQGDGVVQLSVLREKLMRGIQAVSYAASLSMIRPELGSVFVSISPNGFVCAATDSFRLAEKKVSGVRSDEQQDILIPLKHAVELVHILERMQGEEVALSVDDSQLMVSGGGIRFASRIIEGNFPNYKEIIPKQFTTEATLLKSECVEMFRKARVFAGTEQHIGLHVYPKKKIFSATAQSANVGEMSDTLDAALIGDDIDINFNIGYVADCLSSIEADSVVFGFAGPGRPLVIRGVNDSHFTYLVMPLNR
jgi:DNA polymerase III subunit beta